MFHFHLKDRHKKWERWETLGKRGDFAFKICRPHILQTAAAAPHSSTATSAIIMYSICADTRRVLNTSSAHRRSPHCKLRISVTQFETFTHLACTGEIRQDVVEKICNNRVLFHQLQRPFDLKIKDFVCKRRSFFCFLNYDRISCQNVFLSPPHHHICN